MERCFICRKTENNPGDGILDVCECEICFNEFCDDCGDSEKLLCNIHLGKGPVDSRDIM